MRLIDIIGIIVVFIIDFIMLIYIIKRSIRNSKLLSNRDKNVVKCFDSQE